MGKVFSDLGVSADGYATGLNQTEAKPFGDIDESWLHGWMFDTPDENREEIDAILDSGATIMGRNMFGPVRGEWDRDWSGWWGPNPPYHNAVFVLTHYAHDPIEMEGGTTFHFVTDGIHSALDQARAAAGDGDISVAGGPSTVNAVPHRRAARRAAPAHDAVHPRRGRAGLRRRSASGDGAGVGATDVVGDAHHVPHGPLDGRERLLRANGQLDRDPVARAHDCPRRARRS